MAKCSCLAVWILVKFLFSSCVPELALLAELPDELANPGTSPSISENGTKDLLPDTLQKHQQLSQLLSSNNTPVSNSGLGQASLIDMGLNSFNAVKSPMQNSLSSPPNISVSKAVSTSTAHGLNNDILNVAYSSSIGTSCAVSNSSIFSMSVANPMSKPMTSQALKNNGTANMHQNQLMNGPHVGLNSGASLQRGVATTMGLSNLQATLSQSPNMMANTTMSTINSMAAGQLQNNQLDLNHPMNTSQPQLVQVCFTFHCTCRVLFISYKIVWSLVL